MIPRIACVLLIVLLVNAGAEEQVRSTQEELRRRNLYFGDIDGRRSAEFEEAVKRYQKRKGFTASGHEDPETLRSLGLLDRSPNEPRPKELSWPAEPILKSDEKVDVVREASELATSTGIAPETVGPSEIKLVPIASRSQTKQQRTSHTSQPVQNSPAPHGKSHAQATQTVDPAEIVKFVKDYLRATERGNLRKELCFYADYVDYYSNGTVDRRIVEHSLRKYYARWPHRHTDLEEIFGFRVNPRTALITVTYRTTFALRNSGTRIKGATDNVIVINAATSSPRIVAIREARLRP